MKAKAKKTRPGRPRGVQGVKWRDQKPRARVNLTLDAELHAWWVKSGRQLNLSLTLDEAVEQARTER